MSENTNGETGGTAEVPNGGPVDPTQQQAPVNPSQPHATEHPTQPLYRRPEQHAAYGSAPVQNQPTVAPVPPIPYQGSSYPAPANNTPAQSQPTQQLPPYQQQSAQQQSAQQQPETQRFDSAPGYPASSYPAPANPGASQPGTAQSGDSYLNSLAPAVTAEPKKPKKAGMGLFIGSVAAAALIGALVGGGTSTLFGNGANNSSSSSPAQSVPLVVNNTASVNQISAAAAKAMPSVVTISATSGSSGGTGSGIILNTDGDILTNTHVVTLDGAAAHATIQVQLSNGKVYAGKVVGTDPLSDLAVVKIDAPDLVPATLGSSSKTNVGDSVIAIGSPLGLNATVTEGIVSTLNRTIQVASSAVPTSPDDSSQDGGNSGGGDGGFQFSPPGGSSDRKAATGSVNLNVIQTDAAINPGNSGGALVNASGDVIGVNVAIASAGGSSSGSGTQSGNIGVGFSIPIDHAKRIADEIIAGGKASHGQLGVSVSGTSALGSNSQFSNGATVASVTAGGPAAKAGLQKGDVVTQLGDRLITDASSLTAAVREDAGGQKVALTYLRDGKATTTDVTLGTYSG